MNALLASRHLSALLSHTTHGMPLRRNILFYHTQILNPRHWITTANARQGQSRRGQDQNEHRQRQRGRRGRIIPPQIDQIDPYGVRPRRPHLHRLLRAESE